LQHLGAHEAMTVVHVLTQRVNELFSHLLLVGVQLVPRQHVGDEFAEYRQHGVTQGEGVRLEEGEKEGDEREEHVRHQVSNFGEENGVRLGSDGVFLEIVG